MTKFIGHLVNQQVADDMVAFEIALLLLENPSGALLSTPLPQGYEAKTCHALWHTAILTNVILIFCRTDFALHACMLRPLGLICVLLAEIFIFQGARNKLLVATTAGFLIAPVPGLQRTVWRLLWSSSKLWEPTCRMSTRRGSTCVCFLHPKHHAVCCSSTFLCSPALLIPVLVDFKD